MSISLAKPIPKAFLVGVQYSHNSIEESQALLEELDELVSNLHFAVAGKELVRLRQPNPKYLLGSGKTLELIDKAKALGCTYIVFDDELSPAQQRNWEKDSSLRVIDRNEVILEIFAQRAQTREARLQVELALQQYMLPRLTRAWTHLSRQRGGGGVTQRGEGETQLEIDQRLVRNKISKLQQELKTVIQQRSTQRKQRMKIPLPSAAIVGYTNAGKSSLLNCLSQSDVWVADQLFATLDPTTRKIKLPKGQSLLLTDTVGFIRRLPHKLIEAFKATLEEAILADFLIHVIDISSTDAEKHYSTTLKVLEELKAQDKPVLTVFNKIDLVPHPIVQKAMRLVCQDAVEVSVKTGEGIPALLEKIEKIMEKSWKKLKLLLPHHHYDLIHLLHEAASIESQKPQDEGILFTAHVPERILETLKPFVL